MPIKLSHPARRRAGVSGIGQLPWGRVALWAGAATVTGLAAATIKPIVELGPGAVVLAGLGGACVASVARAASSWLAASRRGPAAAPTGDDPIVREFVAAISAQLIRLDDKLSNAMAGGGGGGGSAGREAQEALLRAVQRMEREQGAILARVMAEAENAERRSKAQVEALQRSVLPQVAGLGEQVARFRDVLAENDARMRDFEGQVFDILRARDADEVLKRLDSEASDLFDRLFYADARSHATADAWRADYAEWRLRIKNFWDIVRGYKTSVDQPFAVTDAEIERAGGIPETALFSSPDMRARFRMLVVVNERHLKFRDDAFSFNAKKGTPPEAAPQIASRDASAPRAGLKPVIA
ncbi:MAG: hypothetical protein ICV73_00150 [Acetobacteraceae bacterium]|nr:hypothetical protein [Acetobacteraceae bacterium]